MNKFMNRCLIIAFITNILILFILISFWATETFADHVAEEVQTQANKRTDLFEKSVDDLKSLENQLAEGNQANINSMGDGKTNAPQGISFITKKSKSELENESKKLEAIHENDLNSLGREEIIKNNTLNELYPDYSRPLNKQLMKDAKVIAEAQNDLLYNLLAKLKELGVDCKTIKGDQKHEPEYFLKLKNSISSDSQRRLGRGSGDTIYNQTFCEELRNKYSCNDTVTLKCSKTGLRYGAWQDREIALGGAMLYNNYTNWGWSVKLEYKYHVWYIHNNHPRGFWGGGTESNLNAQQINDQVRQFIASKLGGGIDQIYEVIGFPAGGRGIGNITPLYSRWRQAWDNYVFKYKYRDSYQICEVWSEDWTERCRLQ